jgi:hypothetical protein
MSEAKKGTRYIPYDTIWTLYKKKATPDAKITLTSAFTMPTIRKDVIHSENFNGETKILIRFLFHRSSNKFTPISYCARHVISQSKIPETMIRIMGDALGAIEFK